jgi:hypothetical protein
VTAEERESRIQYMRIYLKIVKRLNTFYWCAASSVLNCKFAGNVNGKLKSLPILEWSFVLGYSCLTGRPRKSGHFFVWR